MKSHDEIFELLNDEVVAIKLVSGDINVCTRVMSAVPFAVVPKIIESDSVAYSINLKQIVNINPVDIKDFYVV